MNAIRRYAMSRSSIFVPRIPAVLVVATILAACGGGSTGSPDADADVEDTVPDTALDLPTDPAPETVTDAVEDPDVVEDPIEDPAPDPVDDPTPDPVDDPTPDPVDDPTPDPVVDPTPDPVVDTTPDPVVDTTPDPSTDISPDTSICPDDSYEDNDTDTTASTGITTGSYTGLRICPSDDDYYAVAVGAGQAITVDLFFSDAEGDIDLEIIDPSGTSVAYSDSVTDDEHASYTSTSGGTYLVYVYLWADSGTSIGNGYDMDITVGAPPVCAEDTYEDNDTDTAASVITAGSIPSLRICPGDDDYYTTRVLTGQTITVDVLFLHAEGDVDVELFDASGASVDTSTSMTDNETVTHTATSDGAYIIYIYLYADDGTTLGNDYSIDLTIT
jgi:hypothetical protein